jgi:hypothetical protein
VTKHRSSAQLHVPRSTHATLFRREGVDQRGQKTMGGARPSGSRQHSSPERRTGQRSSRRVAGIPQASGALTLVTRPCPGALLQSGADVRGVWHLVRRVSRTRFRGAHVASSRGASCPG